MELVVDTGDALLPATLDYPEDAIRGGLIALHGAQAGERSFFLYEHLAAVLPERGIAVLRYDRRGSVDGADVPLDRQAGDARAAIGLLRQHVGARPVGLWGWSQGAWAAPLMAATYPGDVAFVVVVSSSGVSPAEQMRFGTAEQLRLHGYGAEDLRELAALRRAVEEYLRGWRDRATAQAVVDRAARRPWFPLVYIGPQLPEPGTWHDMDFDPEPVFSRVRCPILAFYGETDEWVPIDASDATWQRAREHGGNPDISVVRLAGCDHAPTVNKRQDIDGISPAYTATLLAWLDERL